MKQLNDNGLLPDECAYCGASPASTRDHVIPRKFQPKGEEPWESLAVRACNWCNGIKAGFDEQARNLLALHEASAGNESAANLVRIETERSMSYLQEEGRTSPTLEMLKSMQPVQVIEDDGTLETMMAGSPGRDIFSAWLKYVVQGLTDALWGTRLPEAEYEIRAFEPDNFKLYLNEVKPFEYFVPLGKHTKFSYDPMGFAPHLGQWVVQILWGLGFAVLAVPHGVLEATDP